MFTLEFQGKPIAWKRARRRGKRYFDTQLEDKIKYQMVAKLQMEGVEAFINPISLFFRFNMPIPPSRPKKWRQNAPGMGHVFTPDLDNLVKFMGDALNGIVWEDDKLIYEIKAQKIYAEKPSTLLEVYAYDE
jgi:Holliday junction resolvase RusA-like endonuclease|tara:strand:- start:755 stop:1150 length:396 start_codon:yes stop_codon:yes gene_type:complete